MKKSYLSRLFFPHALLTVALIATAAFSANAQVGIGTTTPDPSAQLEVKATNKGVLIPRMPESARTGISNPATGLLVYQTDGVAGFYYYTGSGWTALKSEAPAASPAIIPFASGTQVSLTTLIGGLAGTSAALGFGNSVSGITIASPFIDVTMLNNMAFSVPRNGTITAISGFFSNTVALSLLGIVATVQVQLYEAPEGSNSFSPILGTSVMLAPALTGLIMIGTPLSGSLTGLSIPVTAGSRLLLVYSVSTTGSPIAVTLIGNASAGVAIN